MNIGHRLAIRLGQLSYQEIKSNTLCDAPKSLVDSTALDNSKDNHVN